MSGRTSDKDCRLSASVDLITTSVAHRDGITVLSIAGEIDAATASVFEAAVASVLVEDPAGLVIDLSAVEFMGSVRLRILVSAKERIGQSAGFAVVAHNAAISRPIQLTGLDEAFSLYSTLEDALAAMREPMV
jgi:anti-sigma B factor antagonist